MTFHCAVVIPTKNAMPRLQGVMDKVLHQKTPFEYEVIVIDSGSKDGTVSYIKSLDQVRLIEIDPKDFGHGRTRNLAIQAADAEFVALLTHDAEPVDDQWLVRLVAAVEQDPQIAGAFGRHIAYDDASPFTKHDLDTHFSGFLNHPLVVHRELDAEKYDTDEGWKQFLHFFSDNNAILRKAIWQHIPYPDVEFAEDQLWARHIIEAGYSKAYAPEAAVYHSHDYSSIEQLRRAFDESRNFSKYFGYKLSPTLLSVLKSTIKFSIQAFRQNLDAATYGRVRFIDRLKRALQRTALVFGHYLGSHHERLPRFVSSALSLDHKLFKA